MLASRVLTTQLAKNQRRNKLRRTLNSKMIISGDEYYKNAYYKNELKVHLVVDN